jgi:uncharacterized protein YutE (UPF0331/DUF86 family)
MDFEKELQQVADFYAFRGYQIRVRPLPEDLPPFAKDFKVEIVGRRGKSGVLVSVKKNRDELAADRDLPRYAEVTAAHPDWRFDFFILEKSDGGGASRELVAKEIQQNLTLAEELLQLERPDFVRPAFTTAWVAFEAAMRMRLRAAGGTPDWGTTPRDLMNELYSEGVFSPDEFARLELACGLRNTLFHGYAADDFDATIVLFIIQVTRELLDESQVVKQGQD